MNKEQAISQIANLAAIYFPEGLPLHMLQKQLVLKGYCPESLIHVNDVHTQVEKYNADKGLHLKLDDNTARSVLKKVNGSEADQVPRLQKIYSLIDYYFGNS